VTKSMLSVSISRTSLPIELQSRKAFLEYLKVSESELNKIKWFRHKMYHQFSIAKENKKNRLINAPDKRLKHLQHKISMLLNALYRVRSPVHGFVHDKSVKSNALAHLRKRYILNIDLKDFFPTITENRVIGLLNSIGIDDDVAVCIGTICCLHNQLPQGAPSSPTLSNMICFRLDKELMTFSKNKRCIYTRYADDITLSSYQPMAFVFEGPAPTAGKFSPKLLDRNLQLIFSSNGFTLNEDKAHYADRHSRRIVTGIKVNEFLNVDRRYIRNIRAALYSIETLGVKKAQKKFEKNHSGNGSIRLFLEGKLSWVGFIKGQSDPVFRSLAIRFNDCFKEHKIDIMPTNQEIINRAVWVVEHMSDDNMAQGSTFFLKDDKLVTAAHCVKNVEEVDVYHPSKPSNVFKARVIKYCEHRDLALLEHSIPSNEYFELTENDKVVNVGDQLVALGYPDFAVGDSINVRNGEVSSLTIKSAVEKIEVTQKLSQGMSGGPLLNSENNVVGVIHKGGPSAGRDFAINISELDKWISSK